LPRSTRRRRTRRTKTLDSALGADTSAKSRGGSGRRASRTVRRPAARIDPQKLTEEILDDVSSRLGLDILGLKREQLVEALRPIVEGILEQYSSRPSKEAIISKIANTSRNVYIMIAAYIVERINSLTSEQLEFVINYGEAIAARHAPRLYAEAKRLGRDDLIPMLRMLWEKYGNPTPIACPYCGFRAVTPDLVCMICGKELSEREVKEAIDFRERLREMVELYSEREVEDAISKGYVIVGDVVKPPSYGVEPGNLILHLTMEERSFLKNLLMVKRGESKPC
jgi:DNA-directed RNA polymerase subunit RPC12/RpoP